MPREPDHRGPARARRRHRPRRHRRRVRPRQDHHPPRQNHVAVEELLADWWRRAEALGFDAPQLAAATSGPVEPPAPNVDALYAALAAPEGICAHLSIFDRADVLAAIVNQPLTPGGYDGEAQPPLIPAQRLEELADGFLASRHVEQLTPGSDTAPARYTTRDMLAVQDRIVARYRAGRHRGAAVVARDVVDEELARHPAPTSVGPTRRSSNGFG